MPTVIRLQFLLALSGLLLLACTQPAPTPTLIPTTTSTPISPTPPDTPITLPLTGTPTATGPTIRVILSVLIEPTDSGSVEVQGYGFYAKDSLVRLKQGEPVHLIAQPNRGWRFKNWRGALSGDQSSQPLVMDASEQVTAVFERKQPPTTALGETIVVVSDRGHYAQAQQQRCQTPYQ